MQDSPAVAAAGPITGNLEPYQLATGKLLRDRFSRPDASSLHRSDEIGDGL